MSEGDESPLDADGGEMGLVMPFVVVASQGGPYDDSSFVAGYQCAGIDAALAAIAASPAVSSPLSRCWTANVFTALMPQVDLIAMRHGFAVEAEPVFEMESEWTAVTFRQEPKP